MKKLFLATLLFVFLFGNLVTVFANVRLPAIIGTHMVLQQNSTVNIWGWCDPGEKVSVSPAWDTTTYHATGFSNAKWSLQIKTPAAGGPYKITINGYNTIVLEDVLVGEVWVCSGQSNMEMSYNWGVKQYKADIENGANKHIRFFQIPKLTADYPQDDTKGMWVVCDTENLKRFSLVGYFFGRQLQQSLNMPVGLINTSWGGTPAETWTPKDTIENNEVLKTAAGKLKAADGWPVSAGFTYNAMINPIINYAIAGAIWYQGEANVNTASTYTQLLQTMIATWRKVWKKDFPFYFVQIAPFAGYGEKGISSALLREAQTRASAFPNTGMVVIHDLVDNIHDIHPQQKKEVGLRLANYALAETYGKKETIYKSPMYKNVAIVKDRAVINFENADKGIMSKGDTITGFYIAGADKIFVPAMAKIQGNTIVAWNKNIKAPVAVRFGFTNDGIPNLFGKDGLPVSIFRTDDWDVKTEPK
ncbi:MAG: sialate O-acetylesterase [Ferruginibacter sp.]